MHDARRHLQVCLLLQVSLGVFQQGQQFASRQYDRIKVNLQRADARGQLQNAIQALLLQPEHQGMSPETQPKVQLQRAVFDQQVAVAGWAIDHLYACLLSAQGFQDR